MSHICQHLPEEPQNLGSHFNGAFGVHVRIGAITLFLCPLTISCLLLCTHHL